MVNFHKWRFNGQSLKRCLFDVLSTTTLVTFLVPTKAAETIIDSLVGVYKSPVTVMFTGGEKLTTENILEVVKISNETAYFRAVLPGANGHTCNIWGVADVVSDGLSFYTPQMNLGDQCLFKLKASDSRINLSDEPVEGKTDGCYFATCGARATYTSQSFELKTRRPIGYMQRLLNSNEYKAATDNRAAGKSGMNLLSAPAGSK